MKDVLPIACPICKSWNWKQESSTTETNFSYGKAAVGAALFGPIGAIAGANGKKDRMCTYKCHDCGYTHTYRL